VLGTKDDKGKARYSLIPPNQLRNIAEVFTHGANKYAEENYLKVEKIRYVDALFRHLEAYRSGELIDKDSGLPHTAHIAANAIILERLEENDTQKD